MPITVLRRLPIILHRKSLSLFHVQTDINLTLCQCQTLAGLDCDESSSACRIAYVSISVSSTSFNFSEVFFISELMTSPFGYCVAVIHGRTVFRTMQQAMDAMCR